MWARDAHASSACVEVAVAPLPLGVELLAVTVAGEDVEVCEAGLRLLVELLRPKTSPFIALQGDDAALRTLYFTLQNQAVKVRQSETSHWQ